MDRLVKSDAKDVELLFHKGQKCSTTFKLTNLMHTMSVAVSLTTTNPSIFSLNKTLSIIPPLSSSTYTIQLSHPSHNHHHPLSDPPDVITVRTSMLPTGKATSDHLRRLFSKPGPHVFRDAIITVSLVGPHVAESIISQFPNRIPENRAGIFAKAVSRCARAELTELLKRAVECGNAEFVAVLIDAGAEAGFRAVNGMSLMPFAIRSGEFEVVKILEASGCGINRSVDLVLHEAAAMNRVDFMEFLLDSFGDELDLNSVDSEGRTPIHVAAVHGHERVIEFCVSVGGNPNAVDFDGCTALHCAASQGHLKAVECLLECSNVKYARNGEGKTAFSVAEECGHSHVLDSLHLGDLLMRAARVDDVHELKRCLGEGASVNRRDQNNWTPLHWAAFKGRIKSVKVLLEYGAEVDAVDDAGYTPLHCAAESGHMQVALLLIGHGSQVNLKSFHGFRDHVPFGLDCTSVYTKRAIAEI